MNEIVRLNARFLRAQHLATGHDRQRWMQGSVAYRLGMSRPSYIDLEAGRRGVPVQDLVGLAYVYDVAPGRLLMPLLGGPLTVPSLGEVAGDHGSRWVQGLEPLPTQDDDFFYAHQHERSSREAVSADGRRHSGQESSTGLGPPQYRLDASRALDSLLRAAEQGDDTATEVYWDHLAEAVTSAHLAGRAPSADGDL